MTHFGFEVPLNWFLSDFDNYSCVLKIEYKRLVYLSISMPVCHCSFSFYISPFFNFTLQKFFMYYIITRMLGNSWFLCLIIIVQIEIYFSGSFKNNGSMVKIIRLTAISHGSFHRRCESWNNSTSRDKIFLEGNIISTHFAKQFTWLMIKYIRSSINYILFNIIMMKSIQLFVHEVDVRSNFASNKTLIRNTAG